MGHEQSCFQEDSCRVIHSTSVKLDEILCDQHALVILACAGFIQHTPDKSFLGNNSADFLDVGVKNLDFLQSLVMFGINSICY